MINQPPKTRQEIAIELGMSYSTFRRWVKKVNLDLSPGLLLPYEQEEIYNKYFRKDSNTSML